MADTSSPKRSRVQKTTLEEEHSVSDSEGDEKKKDPDFMPKEGGSKKRKGGDGSDDEDDEYEFASSNASASKNKMVFVVNKVEGDDETGMFGMLLSDAPDMQRKVINKDVRESKVCVTYNVTMDDD